MKEDKNSKKVNSDLKKQNKNQKTFTEELKQIEQLQTDGMQENTITRKKNRIKFRILIILLLLFIVGIGVAVFFVLQNQRHRDVHIIANVEVTSYINDRGSISGLDKDKFSFRAEDRPGRKFSKEVDCVLDEYSVLKIEYLIENKTVNRYNYSLDFADLKIENIDAVCYIENKGDLFAISGTNNLYQFSSKEKFVKIVVEIEVDNKDINAECFGQIDLTLSSVK